MTNQDYYSLDKRKKQTKYYLATYILIDLDLADKSVLQ